MALIRNNIKGNNLNITMIMEKAKIDKGLIFDKLIINSYRKCKGKMDSEKASLILHIENIVKYNSTDDHYISMDPLDYQFTSNPSFSAEDNLILRKFYGVKIQN